MAVRDAAGRFVRGSGASRAGTRISDKDKGLIKVLRTLGEKDDRVLLIGVLGEKANAPAEKAPGLTVAEIAEAHELGLGVPERSWLRGWLDENKDGIDKALTAAYRKVIAGEWSKTRALGVLGARFVGEIQARISRGIEPPNSQATIDAKGSSTPLIDTGQMHSAITWLVDEWFLGQGL